MNEEVGMRKWLPITVGLVFVPCVAALIIFAAVPPLPPEGYRTFGENLSSLAREVQGFLSSLATQVQDFIHQWYPLLATLLGVWFLLLVKYGIKDSLRERVKFRETVQQHLRDMKGEVGELTTLVKKVLPEALENLDPIPREQPPRSHANI
jgi:hypothetical protein